MRWLNSPNLVKGDFETGSENPAGWDPLPAYVSRATAATAQNERNQVVRFQFPRDIAASTGVLYYSDFFPIEQGAVYRFQCRWRTTGSAAKVFIKCYDELPTRFAEGQDNAGGVQRREVYRSHVEGSEDAGASGMPDDVLRARVRRYLKLSRLLEDRWNTPVTGEALSRELERIARDTKMPGRLAEVYAALGHDRFVLEECLARPVLVERLARRFFASDERVHGEARARAEAVREAVPGMPGWGMPLLIVLALVNLACAIALFKWKMWGFWGICITSAIALGVNLAAGLGIRSAVTGLLGVLILYGVLQIGKENKGWPQLD